jgi:hypothetical protein
MGRVAVAVAALAGALLAGCGSAHHAAPATAFLIGVHVEARSVRFAFESGPGEVAAAYQPKAQLVESGSGAPVALDGKAYVVIHFRPAATADSENEKLRVTYRGPRRLRGPGPVLEVAKTSDFEADLAWAIGLERHLPFRVTQDGAAVTVTFG